jgi:hypothetical protein
VEVQLTSKTPAAGAVLRRLKRASVLRAPSWLVCGKADGVVMTFCLRSVENLMKLVPAPTMSKRILKSV